MLTKLSARNFKRLGDVEIELGNPVVFVGPNNSGKTSAMQALALWDIGLKRWNENRAGKRTPGSRPGVTINRKDLFAIPHPTAALLWRDLHVRNVRKIDHRQQTDNVRIDIVVEGVERDKAWRCGLEFDYANAESFYCRPLRLGDGKRPERMTVPSEAGSVNIAFLPPMSGLAATETRLDQGAINVRVGEGRTADVLRNLCFRVLERNPDGWQTLVSRIRALFAVDLENPRYIEERGEITMAYRERGKVLDLSSSGRGLQQTLLILAYMYAHPGAVILLEEPDAHLEILRQRQIYALIADIATRNGNQIIAASHSEVLLNEAAGKDLVIAFVGTPHRIGDDGSQVRKSLAKIGFDQYYQAEQTGWVLYLEGSTDLAILRAFARRLNRDKAVGLLERPFVHYVGNSPRAVADHFHGLREALPDLKGIALFDRLERGMSRKTRRSGISPGGSGRSRIIFVLKRLSKHTPARRQRRTSRCPCSRRQEADRRRGSNAGVGLGDQRMPWICWEKGSPWGDDVKVSDEFLTPLFRDLFSESSIIQNLMSKNADSTHLLHTFPSTRSTPKSARCWMRNHGCCRKR